MTECTLLNEYFPCKYIGKLLFICTHKWGLLDNPLAPPHTLLITLLNQTRGRGERGEGGKNGGRGQI